MKSFFDGGKIISACALVMLAGCSGGDSQVAGIEGSGDTLSSPVSTSGTITGFGSVYVNGVRYPTEQASISIEGTPATEADLRPGMVVTIAATQEGEDLAVDAIGHDRLIHGPIDSVEALDPGHKRLSILGQAVVATADAAFEGVEFTTLAADTIVTVSGFSNGKGTYLATRILVHPDAAPEQDWEVEGPVAAVDDANSQLQIGSLQVHYDEAVFSQGQREDLVAGATVEVHGALIAEGQLEAASVRIKAAAPAPAGTRLSLEGLAADIKSDASFSINGRAVDASGATLARGSLDLLAAGARVAAAGELNDTGVLVAETLTFLLPSQSRLQAPVDTVDAASGEFTALGTTFTTDDFTLYEDRSPAADRRINARSLNAGDTVEIHGYSRDGKMVATHVVRKEPSEQLVLKGPVTGVSGSGIQVLGVQVDIADAEGAFQLADLQPGVFVTVNGSLSGSRSMVATHLELHGEKGCLAPVAVACDPADMGPEKAVGRP